MDRLLHGGNAVGNGAGSHRSLLSSVVWSPRELVLAALNSVHTPPEDTRACQRPATRNWVLHGAPSLISEWLRYREARVEPSPEERSPARGHSLAAAYRRP
jgi:hypothetical protein